MRTRYKIIAISLVPLILVGGYLLTGTHKKKIETKITITDYIHHTASTENGDTYVLKDHNVVTVKANSEPFQVQASLFTKDRLRSKTVMERLLWLMQATGANSNFTQDAAEKIQSSPEINKEDFVILLQEPGGIKHRFSLKNTGYHQFNILSYERF